MLNPNSCSQRFFQMLNPDSCSQLRNMQNAFPLSLQKSPLKNVANRHSEYGGCEKWWNSFRGSKTIRAGCGRARVRGHLASGEMTPDVLEDRVTISWKSSSTVVICAKRRSHLHFLDFGGLGSHILFENRQKRDLLGYIFVWWTWVSYLIWKSTNDRFSNTKCTPNLRFGGLFAHFLFENRPMIDFQIRNAPVTFDLAAFLLMSYLKIDQWSIFKYEMDPSPPIWRPFRSFPIWKSTNDRFWNRKLKNRQCKTHFL